MVEEDKHLLQGIQTQGGICRDWERLASRKTAIPRHWGEIRNDQLEGNERNMLLEGAGGSCVHRARHSLSFLGHALKKKKCVLFHYSILFFPPFGILWKGVKWEAVKCEKGWGWKDALWYPIILIGGRWKRWKQLLQSCLSKESDQFEHTFLLRSFCKAHLPLPGVPPIVMGHECMQTEAHRKYETHSCPNTDDLRDDSHRFLHGDWICLRSNISLENYPE